VSIFICWGGVLDAARGLPISISFKVGSIPGGATSRIHDIPQHLNSLHLDFKIACRHSPPNPRMLADSVNQKALSKVEYQGSDILILYITNIKMKLKNVKPSDRKNKKLVATFATNSGDKSVHFGAKNYSDYTIHKDPERRKRYLDRHRKREDWSDPDTAGSLAKHLLWGETTSLKKNIELFKKKFNL